MVNTILKKADLFCPNSVRINFTIYQSIFLRHAIRGLIISITCDCA
ncbi:ABC transporter ATP-binding protein [Lactiplantibacillus plantarum]|nr:ABC transporter ATP-binding protein [Lactiplantibacillus plantarum]